ncbi:MAG TPA: hypothetical protein VEY09_17870 [Pyrinomonadaceae bacterium]|nr:hypothetical protein [Pyrinomonadaceae bacterium]
MPSNVKLRLELTDVYGRPLREQLDIILRNLDLNEVTRHRAAGAARIEIPGLRGMPQGRYRIDVDPPSYQYFSRFFNMKASGTTTLRQVFMIDPGKVVGVNFPRFARLAPDLRRLLENTSSLESFPGKSGRELYDAPEMDPIRRAGLLNIATKSAVTVFANGRSVLSYVQELRKLRGDRFYAVVPRELREEARNAVNYGLFRKVSGALHRPDPGFEEVGSFKTGDRYGNLQLTFFARGDDYVADMDIDDAGGFEHVFQVLRNRLSGEPTHPYNIHDILVATQNLDPGYTFVV